MISYLEGTILLKAKEFVILEVNGVGYKVFLSERSLEKIPGKGERLKVFCYLDVGERSLSLYGFLSIEELNLFEMLRRVSGIGPLAALQVCAQKEVKEIREAIEKGDIRFLQAIKGIGRKKAQKIVLELSGRLRQEVFLSGEEKEREDQALSALVGLGFKREEAREALSQVSPNIKDSQVRVKEALKILGRNK